MDEETHQLRKLFGEAGLMVANALDTTRFIFDDHTTIPTPDRGMLRIESEGVEDDELQVVVHFVHREKYERTASEEGGEICIHTAINDTIQVKAERSVRFRTPSNPLAIPDIANRALDLWIDHVEMNTPLEIDREKRDLIHRLGVQEFDNFIDAIKASEKEGST